MTPPEREAGSCAAAYKTTKDTDTNWKMNYTAGAVAPIAQDSGLKTQD